MIKYLKIFSAVLVVCAALVSLSACEKAGTELSELMIIQGIGIDFEKDKYTVTVEILNNEQSGSPSGDSASENKTKIYSMQGDSVAEALRLLTTKSGNLPLFAHNRVIVLSEKLEGKQISDVLEFFVRNYDSRVSQLMCVSKGKRAEEVIRARLMSDTVKSEILENLLVESYESSLIPRVRVIDAVNALGNSLQALAVPSITVNKNGEYEDYKLLGCVVYDGDNKLSGYLSSEQAEGLAFLNDDVKKGFFTEALPNGNKATFVINKSSTRLEATTQNGDLVYYMTVNISCDVDESGVVDGELDDKQIMKALKDTVRKAVVRKVESTLDALRKINGGDCIRYYKRLQLEKPELFKSAESQWSSVFSSAETIVNVNVTIRRVGEETLENNRGK